MVHSTVGGACGFCVRGLVMGTLWKQCGRWYNFSIFSGYRAFQRNSENGQHVS